MSSGYLGELLIRIIGDNAQFDSAIDQSEKKFTGAAANIAKSGQDIAQVMNKSGAATSEYTNMVKGMVVAQEEAQRKLDDLKNKGVDPLNTSYVLAQKSLDKITSQIAEVTAAENSNENVLSGVAGSTKTYANALEELKARLTEAYNGFVNVSASTKSNKDEIDVAKQKYLDLDNQVKELEKSTKIYGSALEALKAQQSDVQKQMGNLTVDGIVPNSEALQTLSKRNDELTQQIKLIENSVKPYTSTLQELKARYEEVSVAMQKLVVTGDTSSVTFKELKSESDELKQKMDAIKESTKTYGSALEELEAHQKKIQISMQDLTIAGQQGSDAFKELSNENKNLTKQIEEAKNSVKEHISALETLKTRQKEVQIEMQNLTANGQQNTSAFKELSRENNELSQQIKITENSSKTLNDTMKELSSTAGKIGGVLSVSVTAPIIAMGKAAIENASNLEVSTNKFNDLFSNVLPDAQKSVALLTDQYKQTNQQAIVFLANSGNVFKSMGATDEATLHYATSLSELTAQIAAYSGKSMLDVNNALNLAVLGNTRNLRNYGLAIRESALQDELKKNGQDKLTGSALQLATAEAALKLITEASSTAVKNFNKDSESATFSVQELQAQIKQQSTEIGNSYLPAYKQLLVVIKDVVSAWASLNDSTKTGIATFTLAVAAIGPAELAISGLAKVIPVVTTAIKALIAGTASIATIASVAVAGIVLLVGAVVALKKASDEATEKKFLGGIAEQLKEGNTQGENIVKRIKEVSNESGVAVSVVADLAEKEGLVTDENRAQVEALKKANEEHDKLLGNVSEVAKKNKEIKDYIQDHFVALEKENTTQENVRKQVDLIALGTGSSKEQVIALLEQSELVSDEYRTQLQLLKDQIIQEQNITNAIEDREKKRLEGQSYLATQQTKDKQAIGVIKSYNEEMKKSSGISDISERTTKQLELTSNFVLKLKDLWQTTTPIYAQALAKQTKLLQTQTNLTNFTGKMTDILDKFNGSIQTTENVLSSAIGKSMSDSEKASKKNETLLSALHDRIVSLFELWSDPDYSSFFGKNNQTELNNLIVAYEKAGGTISDFNSLFGKLTGSQKDGEKDTEKLKKAQDEYNLAMGRIRDNTHGTLQDLEDERKAIDTFIDSLSDLGITNSQLITQLKDREGILDYDILQQTKLNTQQKEYTAILDTQILSIETANATLQDFQGTQEELDEATLKAANSKKSAIEAALNSLIAYNVKYNVTSGESIEKIKELRISLGEQNNLIASLTDKVKLQSNAQENYAKNVEGNARRYSTLLGEEGKKEELLTELRIYNEDAYWNAKEKLAQDGFGQDLEWLTEIVEKERTANEKRTKNNDEYWKKYTEYVKKGMNLTSDINTALAELKIYNEDSYNGLKKLYDDKLALGKFYTQEDLDNINAVIDTEKTAFDNRTNIAKENATAIEGIRKTLAEKIKGITNTEEVAELNALDGLIAGWEAVGDSADDVAIRVTTALEDIDFRYGLSERELEQNAEESADAVEKNTKRIEKSIQDYNKSYTNIEEEITKKIELETEDRRKEVLKGLLAQIKDMNGKPLDEIQAFYREASAEINIKFNVEDITKKYKDALESIPTNTTTKSLISLGELPSFDEFFGSISEGEKTVADATNSLSEGGKTVADVANSLSEYVKTLPVDYINKLISANDNLIKSLKDVGITTSKTENENITNLLKEAKTRGEILQVILRVATGDNEYNKNSVELAAERTEKIKEIEEDLTHSIDNEQDDRRRHMLMSLKKQVADWEAAGESIVNIEKWKTDKINDFDMKIAIEKQYRELVLFADTSAEAQVASFKWMGDKISENITNAFSAFSKTAGTGELASSFDALADKLKTQMDALKGATPGTEAYTKLKDEVNATINVMELFGATVKSSNDPEATDELKKAMENVLLAIKDNIPALLQVQGIIDAINKKTIKSIEDRKTELKDILNNTSSEEIEERKLQAEKEATLKLIDEINKKSHKESVKVDTDLSLKFNTELTPEEEKLFKKWGADNAKILGYDLSTAISDYDMSGFFKNVVLPNPGEEWAREIGKHFTDEFKKPNHMTFSTDSMYSSIDMMGGKWEEVFVNVEDEAKRLAGKMDEIAEGAQTKWRFTPSQFLLDNKGEKALKDYFATYEPDAELVIPATTTLSDEDIAKLKEYTELIELLNEVMGKTKSQTAFQKFSDQFSLISSQVIDLIGKINTLFSTIASAQEEAITHSVAVQENEIDRVLAIQKKAIDDNLEALQDSYGATESELQLMFKTLIRLGDNEAAASIYAQKEKEAAIEDYTSLSVEELETLKQAALDANDTTTASYIEEAQKRVQAEKDAADAKEKLEKDAANAKIKLENDAALAKYKIDLESFNTNKQFSIATALIDTASSIVKIWAQHAANPILAAILTAIAVGATAVQIATIKSQAPPSEPVLQNYQLAKGAVVKSTPGGVSATIAEGGEDEVVSPVSTLESMITNAVSKTLDFSVLASAINNLSNTFSDKIVGSTVVSSDMGNIDLTVQIDSEPILNKIFPATKNKKILISANAVV